MNDATYRCMFCGLRFDNFYSLDAHVTECASRIVDATYDAPLYTYQCPLCAEQAQSYTELGIHLAARHHVYIQGFEPRYNSFDLDAPPPGLPPLTSQMDYLAWGMLVGSLTADDL